MNYKMIFNRQFLRLDDKIIPLVLIESEDSTRIDSKKRNRTNRIARNWQIFCINNINENIVKSPNDILEDVNQMCSRETDINFKFLSNWISRDSLVEFFKLGIKSAKTIEEMREKYIFDGMEGIIYVCDNGENAEELAVSINSSSELKNFLLDAQNRIECRKSNEMVHIKLIYKQEKFYLKKFNHKDYGREYFVIKKELKNNGEFFCRLTPKGVKFSDKIAFAKHFLRKSEASKLIEKIKARNPDIKLVIVHMDVV